MTASPMTLDDQGGAHPPLLTVVDEYEKTSSSLPSSPEVLQAGIDDLTLNLRVEDPERRRMLDHWRVGRGKLGTQSRDGFRALWPPHQAFWFAETGTLSIQVKRERKGRLLGAGDLRHAAQQVVGVLVDAGVVDRGDRAFATGLMRCSRLDATVDVAMPSAQSGVELLRALELMPEWGGLYVAGYGRPGEKTVYHKRRRERGSDTVVARVYSRHREELARRPGEVIRFEVEHRYKPSVEARTLTGAIVRDLWVGHFFSMAPTNGKVRIGDRKAVAVKLAERVAAGEITYRQAEQVSAFLEFERSGLLDRTYPARVIRERRRLIKRLGVSLADAGLDDVDVDVGRVVALGVDRSNWGV